MIDSGTQVMDVLAAHERTGVAEDRSLQTHEFLGYCRDIQYQPSWRVQSDKCADYYDGNQLDAQTLSDLAANGMGPLITNVVAPIVNVVLGMEAKTRSDWRVGADTDDLSDVAEVMSEKLHEAERESRADRSISDAYGGQVKAGVGWVEVSRSANPFNYPHRVAYVHRRELYWDWRDQTPELSKYRYMVRRRWYDLDQAKAFFPGQDALFDATMGDSLRMYLDRLHEGTTLSDSLDTQRGLDMEDFENWRSIERKRVCLHEVWYRRWARGYVLRLPEGGAVELNMQNPVHQVLVARGVVRPEAAVYSRMRMGVWCGPFRLMDVASKGDFSPYIPFFGYREDRTGVPYGLIRSMISPQDEVNARRQKLMWILGAKRVEMDDDALATEYNDVDSMLQEIARPDAVVVLNRNRTNKSGGFKVEHGAELARQQFEIMKDAEEATQRVVGVFNSLLGRESAANSGVAIDALVEQGITALAEINDNYRYGRRLVGERLLGQIRNDMIGRQVTVAVGETGKRRMISLNAPVRQPDGSVAILNDVRAAKLKVALEDVPSSPTYRQQQLATLGELMKGMPPELQAAIAPFYVEATDLRQRRDMADAIRKALGQVEPKTPEEEEQLRQQNERAQQQQDDAIMLDLKEREAKIALLNAQAERARREGGDDGAMHQAVQAKLDAAARKVDQLTAQIVTERAQAKLREQGLKNKQQAAGKKDAAGDQIKELKAQMDALVQTMSEEIAAAGRPASAKGAKQEKAAA